jgi:hypothetical protein
MDLRQVNVAKIVGSNEMTILNREKGYTSPRINKLAGVSRFLSNINGENQSVQADFHAKIARAPCAPTFTEYLRRF